MGDDDHDEADYVREWIGRLDAFASSLDDIEGDNATDFADNALEAWQHLTLPSVTGATLCWWSVRIPNVHNSSREPGFGGPSATLSRPWLRPSAWLIA